MDNDDLELEALNFSEDGNQLIEAGSVSSDSEMYLQTASDEVSLSDEYLTKGSEELSDDDDEEAAFNPNK